MIDTYYDTSFGIIEITENEYITNNMGLKETKFYKNLKYKRILRIQENTDEYLELWKKCCDLFFNFLNKNCPNIKVILNPNRHVHNYKDCNGLILKSEKFQNDCEYYNYYRDLLDEYIVKNFDVYVLNFDEYTLADENHMWGPFSLHYITDYYIDMTNQLNEIILIENFNDEKFKKLIKKYQQEKLLLKIKNNYSKRLLSKYSTVRIDLKNNGVKTNKIKIIKNSDLNSKLYSPKWFKDKNGEGIILESDNNKINLSLICINDGILSIHLRTLDLKDKNNNKFPIFIDYVKFVLNDDILIDENILVTHDYPKIFKKSVKNNEIVNIYIEWKPFNKNCVFDKKLF